MPECAAELLEAGGQGGCQVGDAGGDGGEPVGAVIDPIHRRHHGRQHLRGTDVGSCLLAADVLFAGLQGQPIGRLTCGIDTDAYQPAGQRAFEGITAGDVSGMGPATAHRHAEALGGANDDVSPPGSRRR